MYLLVVVSFVCRLKTEDHSSSEADTDSSDRGGRPRRQKKVKRDLFKKSLRLTSEQVVSTLFIAAVLR